jgi:protein phosphatase/serine/threonine-protein phosphatase Stp1
MSELRFRSWASTHNGAVRTHNEDRFVDLPALGLWAVADGAGGHDAGEVASGMIADTLSSIAPDLGAASLLSDIRARIEQTNTALCEAAAQRGPACVIASTLVVLVARGGHFACLWAGDSRAYLLRDGALQQISRDHSLVQELVDAGAIRPEDAENHPRANVITRAVGGSSETLELDKVSGPILAGDRFLLCSDGLCKTLHDDELAALLAADTAGSPSDAMIQAALARKVNDNVTAVVIEATQA